MASTAASRDDERVSPADIKAKLAQIEGSLQSTTKAALPVGVAVGATVVLTVVVLAYALGRRRGRSRRTVVEVRRL